MRIRTWFLALLIGLSFAPAFAAPEGSKGKVLVVVSSESQITLRDGKVHPTGFYMNELLVPLKLVMEAGYTPVFANPKGNAATMDATSNSASHFGDDAKVYEEMKGLLNQLEARPDGLKTPKTLASVQKEGVTGYAGILVPGGHAPMEDLATDVTLGKILTAFHQAGKPTGLICHGPIALFSAAPDAPTKAGTLSRMGKAKISGWPYAGYQVTIFSTPEEKEAETTILRGKVKFYPESALSSAGARVQNGPKWQPHVVRDRELVTGQNPASDKAFGKAFVELLEASKPKS